MPAEQPMPAPHRDQQDPRGAEAEGVIFEIQRWSVDDGPGIRTVVFIKGCPLRCLWCCNPESWRPLPQLALLAERCRGCGQCRAACPQGIAGPAGSPEFAGLPGCTACGRCVSACPSGAREIMGRRMTAGQVLKIIERDRVFYRQSGGGITFSGGEALAQAGFLRELVHRCQAIGLSMALETSGYFPWDGNQDILQAMDLVFLDIKHIDPTAHRRLTGVDNRIILENAIRLARARIPLAIRIPLVPTINDDAENIRATAAFVAEQLDGALGVELLPYHTLGQGKFKTLGLHYSLSSLEPPGKATIAAARQILQEFGIPILHLSGAEAT
jgi:pyruvate formate lyase activating enzyme